MRAATWLGLALILALAAAACSDSEPATDGGNEPTAVADPEADPEADPTAGGHPVGTLTRFDDTVTVDLGEWFVSADVQSIPAGQIRFVATNAGTETHEFVLIEGIDKDGREIAEIEGLSPNESRELAALLSPGRYLLACKIVEVEDGEVEDHFDRGMYTEFVVE